MNDRFAPPRALTLRPLIPGRALMPRVEGLRRAGAGGCVPRGLRALGATVVTAASPEAWLRLSSSSVGGTINHGI